MLIKAYQDFCNTIIHAAKKSIPRCRRKNYRPCWDAECEALYQAFLRAPQGEGSNTAASALLAKLDKRRRKRWSQAVNAIWLAWNAINYLTDRTRQSYRPCLISANSIASQLVKNGTYKTNDREFTRLALKEVSEHWRIPAAVKCIFGDFSPEEFARSLQMLKPGKAPCPDSISPEQITHAGAALKSRLNNFLSSCMRLLKIPKNWRRALVVAIPKPMKPPGWMPASHTIGQPVCSIRQRVIDLFLRYVSPLRSWRDSHTPVLNRSSIPCFLKSKLDFNVVGQLRARLLS